MAIQFNISRRITMRISYVLAASLVLGCYVPVSFAAGASADASVAISSPPDGAKISPKGDVNIDYEVSLGKKGDHTHLYLDSNEAVTLRGLKGTHALGTLPPGQHEICIKVVNKAHTPIGAQKCINVSVEPTV
jgi:hypothetical protein